MDNMSFVREGFVCLGMNCLSDRVTPLQDVSSSNVITRPR